MKQCIQGAVALLIGGLLVAPVSAQVNLSFRTNVSLAGQFANGVAPSAVAWDGSTAFVGTYNNSGAATNTSILPVTDVLTAPVFGTQFGLLNSNNTRGITSLALNGSLLAASWDNGANNVNSVRTFDTTTQSQLWNLSAAGLNLRGNGVALDPGFGGVGTGFGFLGLGGGFARTLNFNTGVAVANTLVNLNPVTTFWRDVAYDPSNGDFYARNGNRVVKGVRTTPTQVNNGSPTTFIDSFTTANFVDNQNIAYVNALGGNFLMVNDRAVASGGQAFTNVVKALGTDGSLLTINYFGGFNPLNSNGAYDFSFHAGTQTLAVSDFTNQQLYIFDVRFGNVAAAAPEPGTALLTLVGIGLFAGLRRTRKS